MGHHPTFKEAGSRSNASAQGLLLLGAQYASLQLHDRAIGAMEAALKADPQMAIARFQLGLLYLTMGDGERATSTLQALDELDDDNALRHFGRGLRAMVNGELTAVQDHLQRGISLNQINPALNADMQRIIDEIAKTQTEPPGLSPVLPSDGHHILLSAYTERSSNY